MARKVKIEENISFRAGAQEGRAPGDELDRDIKRAILLVISIIVVVSILMVILIPMGYDKNVDVPLNGVADDRLIIHKGSGSYYFRCSEGPFSGSWWLDIDYGKYHDRFLVNVGSQVEFRGYHIKVVQFENDIMKLRITL